VCTIVSPCAFVFVWSLLEGQQREYGNVTDHKPPGQPLDIYCTLNM